MFDSSIPASSEALASATSTEVVVPPTQPTAALALVVPKTNKVELIAMTVKGGVANLASVITPFEAKSTDSTPLTTDEQLALRNCEAVITKGLAAFIEVGNALYEIQFRRLYRFQYDSFEAYLAQRWSFKRAQAYRVINACLAAQDLPPDGDCPRPATESQARELIGLTPAQKVQAMNRAKELAGEGAITAEHVKEAAAPLKAARKPKKPAPSPDDEGGQAAAPEAPTTPIDPVSGVTQPGGTVDATFTGTPKSIGEILSLLRTGREAALAAKSLDAAILLLGRIETALVAHVAAKRLTNLVVIDETRPVTTGHVYHGMMNPVLQLQAAA